MISSFASSTSLISIVLVIFLSTTPSLAKIDLKHATSNKIKKLCSGAAPREQERCQDYYKSDHRSATADYDDLAGITIDLANSKGQSLVRWLNVVAKKATNPTWKRRYSQCYVHYSEALKKLGVAKKHLKVKNYPLVQDEAVNAIEFSHECSADFVGVDELWELSQKGKEFEFIISFVHPAVKLIPKSSKKLHLP